MVDTFLLAHRDGRLPVELLALAGLGAAQVVALRRSASAARPAARQ